MTLAFTNPPPRAAFNRRFTHDVASRCSAALLTLSMAALLAVATPAVAMDPLPEFTLKGIALHPKDLEYSPNDDLIHPTLIKTAGRVKNPLGKYYLYYAPHKHVAISMAYSDRLDGPWEEYEHNPVIEGPSAPDIRWIDDHGKFFMWGHRKNSQTELWTSNDGVNFEYDSVSVNASNIGTRNATYSRVYEYPLERFGSKYIMLYSGFIEGREIRCVWLAHSKDARYWTQLKVPLVEPVKGEMNDCYGPALLRWKGRIFITYQDHTTWRGGNLKCVEVDQQLNAVGAKGERHVLIDPPSRPPMNDRLRGAEFYREGDTLYLYSSASRNPRLIVYATTRAGESDVQTGPAPTATSLSTPQSVEGKSPAAPRPKLKPYPSVDELPALEKLPDPFQFFQSERRVGSLQDWNERRAEIRRLDEHYSVGPAFPQTQNARIENVESTDVYGGKATHYRLSLEVGPKHEITCRFEYVMPKGDGPTPLIFYICPRKEYADECIPWQEKIIDRGYGFAWAIPGQFNGYSEHGPVKDAFPEVKGNTMMAWVWGINELIHHLKTRHNFDKVVITGTSRFGKTATAAGVVNENIDLTVPVTGGFAVELFNLTNNKMSAEQMATKCYANEVMTTFAGQLERLPIDQHFRGALIAPRAFLGIMGAENNKKNRSNIEAYEALVPIYEWLGVRHKLGLYDHSPHGHGICEDDMHTIMDFADRIFYGKKPKSGKAFDQINNPDLNGFEWKAPATKAGQ